MSNVIPTQSKKHAIIAAVMGLPEDSGNLEIIEAVARVPVDAAIIDSLRCNLGLGKRRAVSEDAGKPWGHE